MFDFDEYKLTPIFIRGVVDESTPINELDECVKQNQGLPVGKRSRCNYSFSATVMEVYKGETQAKKLLFNYAYWNGCPGTVTFNPGEEWIFALKSVNQDGKAELYSTACGGHGVEAKEKKLVRKLMQIIQKNKPTVNKH